MEPEVVGSGREGGVIGPGFLKLFWEPEDKEIEQEDAHVSRWGAYQSQYSFYSCLFVLKLPGGAHVGDLSLPNLSTEAALAISLFYTGD